MAEQITETTVSELDEQTFFLRASKTEVIKVAVLGLLIGLLIPAIGFLLEKYFIEPVFCRTAADTLQVCGNGGMTAYYVSTVLLSGLAIVFLANWQVFRPLLVAIGAAAALWGLKRYLNDMVGASGIEYFALSGILFAFAYLLFYWVMRVRTFVVSVVIAVIAVVAIRWALIA